MPAADGSVFAYSKTAAAAYGRESSPELQTALGSDGDITRIRGGNARGLTYTKFGGTSLVVAFAGVDDPRDLLDAADVRLVPFVVDDIANRRECGRVHSGLRAHYEKLRPAVWEAVKAFCDGKPDKEIVFVGHGIGACVCLAAVETALLPRPPTIRVYTYGAPRLGDMKFAKAFDDLVVVARRVVHPQDVVPTFPGSCWYAHVGAEVSTDRSMQGHSASTPKPGGRIGTVLRDMALVMWCLSVDTDGEAPVTAQGYVEALGWLEDVPA